MAACAWPSMKKVNGAGRAMATTAAVTVAVRVTTWPTTEGFCVRSVASFFFF